MNASKVKVLMSPHKLALRPSRGGVENELC